MSFAETFAGTLEYAPKVLEDNYEGPAERRRATTFPPLETPVPDLQSVSAAPSASAAITLKSIRTPKFTVEYTVPLADSVYSLKERLLTDPSGPLKDAGVQHSPSSMKILIKSKVIPDTRQLAELNSTSFIVMFINTDEVKQDLQTPLPAQIYWGEEAALLNRPPPHTEPSSEQTKAKLPGVNEQFWKEVETVARRYVEDPAVLVKQMKLNVENGQIETDLD